MAGMRSGCDRSRGKGAASGTLTETSSSSTGSAYARSPSATTTPPWSPPPLAPSAMSTTGIDAGVPASAAAPSLTFHCNDLAGPQVLCSISTPCRIACVILELERDEPPRDNFLHSVADRGTAVRVSFPRRRRTEPKHMRSPRRAPLSVSIARKTSSASLCSPSIAVSTDSALVQPIPRTMSSVRSSSDLSTTCASASESGAGG